MGLFPQSFIDDLRLQANIVQVIQEYVPLKKAGSTYKGLCPFHGEKTPSFHVNRDKGFFHCFGCGVGGDVFKFLELHDKLAFPDAVKQLAQRFGHFRHPLAQQGDFRRHQCEIVGRAVRHARRVDILGAKEIQVAPCHLGCRGSQSVDDVGRGNLALIERA